MFGSEVFYFFVYFIFYKFDIGLYLIEKNLGIEVRCGFREKKK